MNNASIIQVLLVWKKINIVPVQAIYFTVFNRVKNKSKKKHNTVIKKEVFLAILAEFSGPKYNAV